MAEPELPPRPFAIASDRAWFDPALVCRNSDFYTNIITVPTGNPTLVARQNIYRYAIGFILASGGGFNGKVMTSATIVATAGIELAVNKLVWYDLRTFGPLVASEWWGVFSPTCQVVVYEVLRRTSGK